LFGNTDKIEFNTLSKMFVAASFAFDVWKLTFRKERPFFKIYVLSKRFQTFTVKGSVLQQIRNN